MIKKVHTFLFFLCCIIIYSDYKIIDKKIFFDTKQVLREVGVEKYDNPDIKTFRTISKYYAKDKYTVYRRNENIKFSDSDTFTLLKYEFSKDKNNVYKFENIVKGIDSNTFVLFSNQKDDFLYGYIFFKDKNGIYASSNIYDNLGDYCQLHKNEVKLESFNILKDGYVKYNGKIYYGCKEIDKADKNTFEVLKLGFSKDKENIYYYTNKLPKFDIDTFEIFSNQKDESYIFYLKDKNGIYALIEESQIPFEYKVQKISADVKNFEILNDKIARDKKYKYIFDEENKILKKILIKG
ncbi:DKNYY domain-containing protein [Leptotrichia trevisanii]